jgi:hypothetical protein
MRPVLLTPTRFRPASFSLVEKWVARQTVKHARWLVVCDGDVSKYRFTMGQEVIVRRPVASSKHSVCLNYLAALDALQCTTFAPDTLFFPIEDDDYLRPDYLATLTREAEEAPLVGLAPARYYHLHSSTYTILPNKHHCSLSATAFRPEVLSVFRQGCELGNPFIDQFLWVHWRDTLQRPAKITSNGQHIGLKDGLGVGTGHERLQHEDTDGAVLREWLGEDADYIKI